MDMMRFTDRLKATSNLYLHMYSQNKDFIKEDIKCIATFGMCYNFYESEILKEEDIKHICMYVCI